LGLEFDAMGFSALNPSALVRRKLSLQALTHEAVMALPLLRELLFAGRPALLFHRAS
jgi:hypothetical protein